MTTFVALLRAVNVGAANRCSMADLRAAFASAGFADVVTHIQTGNVIFTSHDSANAVKVAVERAVEKDMGFTSTAMIRTAKQMAMIAGSNPFDIAAGVAVFFLDAKPAAAGVAALGELTFSDAECRVVGSEVFALYPNGMGRSKLTNVVIEKKLGVRATARNLGVAVKLAELARDHRAARR